MIFMADLYWTENQGNVQGSDPHPVHADPDPGFEIYADQDLDPDPGLVLQMKKGKKRDLGFRMKIRIRIQELQKCGSNADQDPKPW